MEHRHPHLILGIDHGASAEQAAAAFGRKAKRARRDPDAPFSIEDLTWALNQLEHGEQDSADAFTQLQVPADPDAYQDPNQPKAAQQQLRRISPKDPATSRLLRDTHQRRQQLSSAAGIDSQPAFFHAHQGAEHLPALPPPTAAHPLRRTVLVGATAAVAAIAFAISTFLFPQNVEAPPRPEAEIELEVPENSGQVDQEAVELEVADSNAPQVSTFELVTEGTLTVCSDIPYAPFQFADPDAPTGYSGFDIELMEAIAVDLQLEISIIASRFEELVSGAALEDGYCDIAASAITITEERTGNVDFTEPYYEAKQSLLVQVNSGIHGWSDLHSGSSVGVQSGTIGELYAMEYLSGAEVVALESSAALIAALESGRIDAILQDLPVSAEQARADGGVTVVAELDTGEFYGFAVRKGRADGLATAVDSALSQVRADSIYTALYNKYFSAE